MTQYRATGIKYNAHLSYRGTASVVSPKELPTFVLRATSSEGTVGILPKVTIDNMSFESNQPGVVSFSIAESATNAALVKDLTRIDLLMNGVVVKDGSWLIRDQDWEEGPQLKVYKWNGLNYLWDRLNKGIVWDDKVYKYENVTIGAILHDMFTRLKNRGGLEDLTWTFSAASDSQGNSWNSVVSLEFKKGTKYSDVVNSIIEAGLLDIWQEDNVIKCGVPDRSVVGNKTFLILGKDVRNAPQKASAQNYIGHLMVMGDNDQSLTLHNNGLDTTIGFREEGTVSVGNVTSLDVAGYNALNASASPRVQRTYEVVMNPDRPFLPLRDYLVDQSIRVNHGRNNTLNAKVKQITMQVASSGIMTAGIVLNDMFLEYDLRMARMLAGMQAGDIIVGKANSSTPDVQKDTTTPNQIAGFGLTSDVYMNASGVAKSWVLANWLPVTQNTDGTPITDLSSYRLVWWYTTLGYDSAEMVILPTDRTSFMINNLDPLREISAFMYALDASGKAGARTGVETIIGAGDTIAPNQPSPPVLRSLLKQMLAGWDGLDATGQPMAPDFKQIRVYTNVNSPFGPEKTDGIFKGTLTTAGELQIPGFAIGNNVYVRFVAEDYSGNLSVPSASFQLPVAGVSGPDITANSILSNNIAAGAIQTLHLAAGSVTTDKVTLGQTENLVQDPGFSDAGWRARRLTTEFTEKPGRWAFKGPGQLNWSNNARSGYYLQMLSQSPAGEAQGKMYITDWINVQFGEIYYASVNMKSGEFTPNAEAEVHLGFDVEYMDGSVDSAFISKIWFPVWYKFEYTLGMIEQMGKIRFWIRPNNLTSGDMLIDDMEVRCAVGTTALQGARGQLTPLGLQAWDWDGNQTIDFDFTSGDATVRGTLQSGFTGKRIVVNPSFTYLPEIRFYPTTGDLYAYINSSDSGAYPFIGVNAPDTGVSSNAMVLYDTSMQIGEINKTFSTMVGGGMEVIGQGGPANLRLTGKMTAGYSNIDTFASYLYKNINIGNGTSGSVNITKPASGVAISGQWMLVYSIVKTAGPFDFMHVMSLENSTTFRISLYANTGSFTSGIINVHAFWIRTDGDA